MATVTEGDCGQREHEDDGAEPVDVEAVMEEIRAEIRRKRAAGIYTDAEIEDLARQRLQILCEPGEIGAELLDRIWAPGQGWNISPDYAIRTHRPGLAGQLIVLLKKVVRPLIRLYTDHILYRQAQLNLYSLHLLHNVVREVTKLEVERARLSHRVEVLEDQLAQLVDRERMLEELVEYRTEDLPTECVTIPAGRQIGALTTPLCESPSA
ncbi:MAG: hypothetical protein HYV63_31335 [Candidatus Schekmanbacteria bacterium]|nr:hypothetical protein [Candidatus Schekmanbacteria bacterium]